MCLLVLRITGEDWPLRHQVEFPGERAAKFAWFPVVGHRRTRLRLDAGGLFSQCDQSVSIEEPDRWIPPRPGRAAVAHYPVAVASAQQMLCGSNRPILAEGRS